MTIIELNTKSVGKDIKKYQKIMSVMQDHYQHMLEPQKLKERFKVKGRRYRFYVLEDTGFEIAIGFKFDKVKKKWQVLNVGYITHGSSVDTISDIVVEFIQNFMRKNKIQEVFAVVPRSSNEPSWSEFMDGIQRNWDMRLDDKNQPHTNKTPMIGKNSDNVVDDLLIMEIPS